MTKGATTLASYDYFLRADGQRDHLIETDPNGLTVRTDWTYDALNRLTEEKRDEHKVKKRGHYSFLDLRVKKRGVKKRLP